MIPPLRLVRARTEFPTLNRHLHVVSTVHVKLLSCDVVALDSQKCRGLGYLLRSRKTLERNLGLYLRRDFRREGVHHFSRSIAWSDGICGYIEVRHFARQALGKCNDAAFAGRIVGLPEISGLTYYGADVNDASIFLIHHCLHCCMCAIERTVQIDIDHFHPVVLRHLAQTTIARDSGIVY